MRLKSSRPSKRNSTGGLSLVAVLVAIFVLGVGASSAIAQASEVDEHVAAALYDRGMVLYEQGDVASAKKMFSESLESSSTGNRAGDALRMLRSCNEKLGITDLDAGRPAQSDGPLDPYANPDRGNDGPLDPYGVAPDGSGVPMDPYGNPEGGLDIGAGPVAEASPWSKRGLYAFGGAAGFVAGMALMGPYEDTNGNGSVDTLTGGAVLAGIVGAGGSAYLSYYLAEKIPLSDSESAAVASAGFWGAYNFAHLGNVFTGEGTTDANDIYKSLLLGELAGAGAGYWYAKTYSPSEGDLAFTNSFSLYGTTAGLMLGLTMDPPSGDAYSLNASLGSIAGIGTGLYLVDLANTSRERMLKVDLGAAAGALIPWVLVYPLAADPNTNGDTQLTGFLSVLSMGAGAYLAWHLTDDEDESSGGSSSPQNSPSPALWQRGDKSGWSMGTPIVRPMDLPELLPKQGMSLGADLLSGRF